MTISVTSYSPMCLDPRHYLFLIPVASISAAQIIIKFVEKKKFSIQILISLSLIAILSLFIDKNTFWGLYLPLTVIALLITFTGKKIIFQNLYLVLFVIILLLKPLNMVKYAQKVKYKKQKEILSEYVLSKYDSCQVITNEVQKRLANYYCNFSQNSDIEFVSYKEFKLDTADKRRKILFLNWYTRYLSGMDINELPYYAKNISSSNLLIYENKELNISIYDMIDLSIPKYTEKTLLSTLNDFEKSIPNWYQDNYDISTERKYAGKKSNKLSDFSSTFEYPLDSLQIKNSISLLIKCHFYCYFEDKTESKLVVSVENDSATYLWQGFEINKFLKAYSNWLPVQYAVNISCSELKKNSKLKIYLLNTEKEKAFIDNFDVKIIDISK